MPENNRRYTDSLNDQDPVRDALGALKRRLTEGKVLTPRKIDSEKFNTQIEDASGEFALRAVSVAEVPVAAEARLVVKSRELQETAEAALARYKGQYDKLSGEIKSRCAWEELLSRLTAKGSHYLYLAMVMQDRGELVFIDKDGNPVFRDGGVEPELKGLNYGEARQVLYGIHYEEGTPHFGYEMPDSEEEIRAIEEITKRPFVASDSREEWRESWMESKKNPSLVRVAHFSPRAGNVNFCDNHLPNSGIHGCGVVRLLRVKKMA